MSLPNFTSRRRFVGSVEAAGSHHISNALLFGGTRKLTRTFGAGGSLTEWIFSIWLKRADVSNGVEVLLNVHTSDNDAGYLDISIANNQFRVSGYDTVYRLAAPLIRDPSAFYHFLVSVNTADVTPNDRIQMWINGVRVTAFDTINNPTSLPLNGAVAHSIGDAVSLSGVFNGYLAQPHLLDGVSIQQGDHTIGSFGELDANGVWRPIDVSGLARGTTGFLLPFDDAASTATLGQDEGAGANDWTLNNMAVADQVSDSPTNNFPILNSIGKNATPEISEGGLQVTSAAGGGNFDTPATVALPDGFMFEATVIVGGGGGQPVIGIVNPNGYSPVDVTTGFFNAAAPLDGYGWSSGGTVFRRGGTIFSGPSFTNNDVVTVCVKDGNLYLAKNGVWQNSGDPDDETGAIATGLVGPWLPVASISQGANVKFNFGASGAFTATLPSGVTDCALANLPEPAIKDGSTGFHAALVVKSGDTNFTIPWDVDANVTAFIIKRLNASASVYWLSTLRGLDKYKVSSSLAGEVTDANVLSFSGATGTLRSTLPDGNYIVECFRVAAEFGCEVQETTSTGTTSRTLNHSLAADIDMMATYHAMGAAGFGVYHNELPAPATARLRFDAADGNSPGSTGWGSTDPTPTQFTINETFNWGAAGTIGVTYLFADILGFSRFGTYEGNGLADGPFIYLPFEPAFIAIKRYDTTGAWHIYDAARDPVNPSIGYFELNSTLAEDRNAANAIDFLANGFKIRSTALELNGDGNDFVFWAFAKRPFGGANTTQGIAR